MTNCRMQLGAQYNLELCQFPKLSRDNMSQGATLWQFDFL